MLNEAIQQLGLDQSVRSILLGFEEHQWSISLNWYNDVVQFGSEWVDFVNAAAISVGDLIVLQSTEHVRYYRAVVFDSKTVSEVEHSHGMFICLVSSFLYFLFY